MGPFSRIPGPGPEDRFLRSDQLVRTVNQYGKSTQGLRVMDHRDRRSRRGVEKIRRFSTRLEFPGGSR